MTLPGEQPSTIRLPNGIPRWITVELVEHTLRIWQPYYETILTPEDAVTMIQAVGHLYEVMPFGTPR